MPSPSPGSSGSGLSGIAVVSADAAWAVGYYLAAGGFARTLILHWDGHSWQRAASRNPGADDSLVAVTAVSRENVWAVGSMSSGMPFSGRPLVEHWDGSSWSVVPSPGHGALTGLAAGSAGDMWAVGSQVTGTGTGRKTETLTQHWDGTSWHVVPSRDPGPYGNQLSGVTVAAPDSVWAVGTADNTQFGHTALAEHWTGSGWSVVRVPLVDQGDTLGAITSAGAGDVWAVGSYDQQTPQGTATYALIEQWDGTRWSVLPSPGPTGLDVLTGVAAVSAANVWAVGTTAGDAARFEQWNGRQWTLHPEPYVRNALNLPSGVSASPAADVWAVGTYITLSNHSYHTLIEHLCPAPSPGPCAPSPASPARACAP